MREGMKRPIICGLIALAVAVALVMAYRDIAHVVLTMVGGWKVGEWAAEFGWRAGSDWEDSSDA